MSAIVMTQSNEQSAADLELARAAQKLAEIEHYRALIAHQRERYIAAYNRCRDSPRKEVANSMIAAAVIFESDGKRIPTRLKKAVDVIKIAVFMLDPKAPA
ncbi:hypothetical protein [Burkholderia pseudomallei]|uniref:hypothetical protein n=1 Tax=Burkholderia pseudomallei TaxID=28450 RepID=UPI000A88149C|nr:hypothetical protein [Burkholderia pseudomallei]